MKEKEMKEAGQSEETKQEESQFQETAPSKNGKPDQKKPDNTALEKKNSGETNSAKIAETALGAKPNSEKAPVFKKHPWMNRKKRPEKVHGARQSLMNPEIQTILQHEEHKMRIFKLTMSLVIVFAVLFVGYGFYLHLQTLKETERKIDAEFKNLHQIEYEVQSEYRQKTEKERLAAEGIRRAQSLAGNYPDVKPRTDPLIKVFRDVLRESFPTLAPQGIKGDDFICQTSLIDMVHIPAGTFLMGRSNEITDGIATDELPRREITINGQFWMAAKEIDIYQIRTLIPQFNVPEWGEYRLNGLRQPACNVRWDQASLFCKKLTALEEKAGRVPEGYEYRLPTEAEWEYACRAGTDTVFFWGNSFGEEGAQFANSLDERSAVLYDWDLRPGDNGAKNDKFYVSAPTGSFRPNPWGLYDMSGNVAEWCYDWYDKNAYNDSVTPRKNPVRIHPVNSIYTQRKSFDAGTWDTELPCRVIRGGSWGNAPEKLRSAARTFMPPNEFNTGVGFRPVLAPKIPNNLRN